MVDSSEDENRLHKLYLVVLGGRSKECNIELHDVRWVIGTSINDTIPQLRKEWFGEQIGLHIDSYVEIRFVDGYSIKLEKIKEKTVTINNQDTLISNKKLWFINLGGYDPNQLIELHQFGLIVEETALIAKRKAKDKWLKNTFKTHKDDLSYIDKLDTIDNCQCIDTKNCWKIIIQPDALGRNQRLIPDWYGYWRIDI